MNRFSRLTTGQAGARFLAHQFAESEGQENRFIEKILGDLRLPWKCGGFAETKVFTSKDW